jgi:AcrR family transcriptional regulator
MENTRKKPSKKSGKFTAANMEATYRAFLLREGKKPSSVFAFCQELGIPEVDFYNHFGSFDAIEKSIWQRYFATTRERLEEDEAFSSFTVREKILTFYFTLVETLKNDRSFVLQQINSWKKPGLPPSCLKDFRNSFSEWIKGVIAQGIQAGEIPKRPYLDERYHLLFWPHFLFVLEFWSRDDSAGFEKTDAAIEKSVNLAFDLMGKGILDNALDFGKFLYQTARN